MKQHSTFSTCAKNDEMRHLTPALSPFGPFAPTKRGEGETPAVFSNGEAFSESEQNRVFVALNVGNQVFHFNSTSTG
jgi:hypothetical protein